MASSGRLRPPFAMPCSMSCDALVGLALVDVVAGRCVTRSLPSFAAGAGLLVLGARGLATRRAFLSTRSRRRCWRAASAPVPSTPRGVALVDDLLGLGRRAGLQRELRHLHVVVGRASGCRWRGAGDRRRARARSEKPGFLCSGSEQVDPVLLLRVVDDELLDREHVAAVVAVLLAPRSSSLMRSSAAAAGCARRPGPRPPASRARRRSRRCRYCVCISSCASPGCCRPP